MEFMGYVRYKNFERLENDCIGYISTDKEYKVGDKLSFELPKFEIDKDVQKVKKSSRYFDDIQVPYKVYGDYIPFECKKPFHLFKTNVYKVKIAKGTIILCHSSNDGCFAKEMEIIEKVD